MTAQIAHLTNYLQNKQPVKFVLPADIVTSDGRIKPQFSQRFMQKLAAQAEIAGAYDEIDGILNRRAAEYEAASALEHARELDKYWVEAFHKGHTEGLVANQPNVFWQGELSGFIKALENRSDSIQMFTLPIKDLKPAFQAKSARELSEQIIGAAPENIRLDTYIPFLHERMPAEGSVTPVPRVEFEKDVNVAVITNKEGIEADPKNPSGVTRVNLDALDKSVRSDFVAKASVKEGRFRNKLVQSTPEETFRKLVELNPHEIKPLIVPLRPATPAEMPPVVRVDKFGKEVVAFGDKKAGSEDSSVRKGPIFEKMEKAKEKADAKGQRDLNELMDTMLDEQIEAIEKGKEFIELIEEAMEKGNIEEAKAHEAKLKEQEKVIEKGDAELEKFTEPPERGEPNPKKRKLPEQPEPTPEVKVRMKQIFKPKSTSSSSIETASSDEDSPRPKKVGKAPTEKEPSAKESITPPKKETPAKEPPAPIKGKRPAKKDTKTKEPPAAKKLPLDPK